MVFNESKIGNRNFLGPQNNRISKVCKLDKNFKIRDICAYLNCYSGYRRSPALSKIYEFFSISHYIIVFVIAIQKRGGGAFLIVLIVIKNAPLANFLLIKVQNPRQQQKKMKKRKT